MSKTASAKIWDFNEILPSLSRSGKALLDWLALAPGG